ncbi:ShlB/FhaC/HecB family hemolysin secretion/activation protein [Pantoea sp. FN0307]|uniref:ShlB/FhaC/HecB family hemolysin secretion/activation protein n=1 Tax=Pantoea sp. FN0307 TaxID=3418560 RepID=UPI003CECA853
MNKKVVALFFFSLCHFPVVAQNNVSQLIKEQKNNDNTVRQQSRITKKDIFSTVGNKKTGKIEFPDETLCFRIKKIIINNDFLEKSAAGKLKKNIEGRCLGKRGVIKLAHNIQDGFINAGYITTRVDIPPQDLSSGVLTLNILPGKIETISVENHSVARVILPFAEEDILNIRDIEQGLENLQRTPGTEVKINIEPGERDGYSRVIIYSNRQQKWNFRASANNWGDKSTGKNLASVSGYVWNLAHLNDIFYLSGTRSVSGGYNSISSYYSFPLGYWEYEFFYSYSASHQKIDLDTLNPDYSGKNHYASVKASRTIYRDRDKKVTAFMEVLRRKSDYQLGDITLTLQKRDMSNGRLGINYKQNYAAAMLNSTLAYQRFTRGAGGDLSPDMAAGDVSSRSQLLSLDINYLKPLEYRALQGFYELNVGMQYTPEALVLQDQFSIGNRWSVRGFENSTGLYGDKGFYLQNTLNILTGLSGAEYYCGLDYGEAAMSHSFQQQNKTQRLMGATTGLKGSVKSLGYDLSLSVPLLSPAQLQTDKFTINVNLFYQL